MDQFERSDIIHIKPDDSLPEEDVPPFENLLISNSQESMTDDEISKQVRSYVIQKLLNYLQ